MTIQREIFRKGKEALEKMDFSEAEKLFALSARREPASPAADYLLYARLIRSDYRKIAETLEERRINSGFALYSLYWFQLMTGLLDEAELTLQKMIKTDHYFLRAFAVKEQLKNGKLHDRETAVNDIVRSSGLSYETPLEEERATLFAELLKGNYAEASRISVKLLGEYPSIPDVYLDHMDVLSLSGDQTGLERFTRSDTLDKMANSDFRVALSAARAYYKMNDLENARFHLKRLVAYFRNNPLYHYHLANIWLSQKQYVRAVQGYEEAVSLAPFFERAYYNMGICYFRLGEIPRSSDCFRKALSIHKRPDSLFNYSVCMVEKKNLKEAYFVLNRLPQDNSKKPIEDIKDQIKQLAVYS